MLPSSAVPITDYYTDYSHKQYGPQSQTVWRLCVFSGIHYIHTIPQEL